jgi:hypothetical protein
MRPVTLPFPAPFEDRSAMYEFLHYQVRDAMTADPIAIGPNAKLREV